MKEALIRVKHEESQVIEHVQKRGERLSCRAYISAGVAHNRDEV